jgi:hypothetical protein
MRDLLTPEDVAAFLATHPADHEHERAIDDLADWHGTKRAVVVWRHGQRLHEQRQVTP